MGHLRAGQRMPGPARLRRPERRPDSTRRRRLLQHRLPAGVVSGLGLQAGAALRSRTSARRSHDPSDQARKLDLLRTLDQGVLGRIGHHDALEAAIANYELAFRMQTAVPELISLAGESPATERLYGLDDPYVPDPDLRPRMPDRPAPGRAGRALHRAASARPSAATAGTSTPTCSHGHENNARAVDQPIAALLTDLKARGLLDTTLVVWGGEFGRTPMAQGTDGRDHNPYGFTMWLAGGGIKGGTIYGATDDYGYHAVENKVEVHDLHATMLHLLGIDHKRLTYRFGGRDMRLTDVHGEVVHGIIA